LATEQREIRKGKQADNIACTKARGIAAKLPVYAELAAELREKY